MPIQSVHRTAVVLTPPSKQKASVSVEKQTIQNSPRLTQDSVTLSTLRTHIQDHPIVFTGLTGVATGALVGAGVGYFLPLPSVAKGVGLGAAFGGGAGFVAGLGTSLIVDKWLDGKVSSTTVGLVSGALAGAASGALLGMKLGGSKLMGAAAMAIPGAVAGLVGGLTASSIKNAANPN